MELRVEESILNHSVAISRIEDCKDDMQVCKGDIDAVKIEQTSMARDVRMLEASMGSIHEQLENLGDRVDGQHATIRRMGSLHETHTRFITLEVLKVRQEGRSQYEGCLGKIERIGDLIDKKIVHMDEELDRVVGLVGQKIDSKFGEFSSDFMEAMEIEENRRKDLEAKVAFLEEKLTDSFLCMSNLTNLVLNLQSHVLEVEDAVMEESEDDGGEVASSSSSDLDPVENLVVILVPALSVIHTLVEIPEEFVPPILWPSSAVPSTPSPEYVEAVEDDPVHDGVLEYWADPEVSVDH
jgi:hypothetical protein